MQVLVYSNKRNTKFVYTIESYEDKHKHVNILCELEYGDFHFIIEKSELRAKILTSKGVGWI